jgi:hypothetical protein
VGLERGSFRRFRVFASWCQVSSTQVEDQSPPSGAETFLLFLKANVGETVAADCAWAGLDCLSCVEKYSKADNMRPIFQRRFVDKLTGVT